MLWAIIAGMLIGILILGLGFVLGVVVTALSGERKDVDSVYHGE